MGARSSLVVRGLAASLLAAALGCAGSRPASAPVTSRDAGAKPRLAVLPLEDLSGQAGVADRLTRVVFTTLVQTGDYEVLEPGRVDDALSEARVRSSGMLSQDQIASLSRQLEVRWLLTGSALEYGRVHTPDGDVPAVGIALRLIDGWSGRVRWADQRYRNGDDHETVFGWGRESDGDRLAQQTAAELIRRLRLPADGESTAVNRGAPR